jgi:DNA polymerase V
MDSGITRKATGFASPAQGYEEDGIDFNRLLVVNPSSTVVMTCDTSRLSAFGVPMGAYLVVDRSRKPQNGDMVIIAYEGEFLCRQVFISIKGKTRGVVFSDGNSEFSPDHDEYEFFGVVRGIVRIL